MYMSNKNSLSLREAILYSGQLWVDCSPGKILMLLTYKTLVTMVMIYCILGDGLTILMYLTACR